MATLLKEQSQSQAELLGVVDTFEQDRSLELPITAPDLSRVESIALLLIRMGLALFFSYVSISILLQPGSYIHYLPLFVREIYDPFTELHIFATLGICLSFWLLIGKWSNFSAVVSLLAIFSVTVVNWESFLVVFRNVSIIFFVLALIFLEWKRYKGTSRSNGNDIPAGQYEQAIADNTMDVEKELLQRQVQQGRDDHLTTVDDLNDQASLYYDQGKYLEAEPLYRQVLSIYEQQLGSDHPTIAGSLNNLAVLCQRLGKYTEAESLYERALTIKAQQLGDDHLSTALSLNNLALLYDTSGKHQEARTLFRRVLTIREQALGADHPDTALSMWCLASTYKQQQKYQKAETLYKRAFSAYKRSLWPDHPLLRYMYREYSSLLRTMGRDEEDISLDL